MKRFNNQGLLNLIKFIPFSLQLHKIVMYDITSNNIINN